LLVLLPLRLGIDKVNPLYYDIIKGCLRSPLSVGIVGGRPNRAFYFVGSQDDDLFYLDPHCVRPALVSVPQALSALDLHTDTVRACAIHEIDPSVLLGFLCEGEVEVEELAACLEGLHVGCPLFSIVRD
jgi:cysteine protease ATG4